MKSEISPALRLPLLAAGFIALVLGVGAGLARMGWPFPLPDPRLVIWHGPLMVAGFFGTVISLERAVALGHRWAYLAPLAAALGALALVAAMPLAAMLLFVAAGVVLLAASLAIFRRQPALFTLTPVLGAACWTAGNGLWLSGAAVSAGVSWWVGFLVLTIAGERLELSRLLPPAPLARTLFAVIVAAICCSLIVSLPFPRAGAAAQAAGLLALALWLGRQDIAHRTVRERGLTRFIAVCLLSGYVWLGAGAALLLANGIAATSGAYDAGLHAILLGFVFSMVFGHAPIIFPAVTRATMPYHWSFYIPLVLLQASLAVRIAGDVSEAAEWRRVGAMANAAALLLFVLGTVTAVVRGKLAARGRIADGRG
ncbi:MAG: hypothetical protein WBO23_04685 [Burkholderiales bacterium]